MPDRRMVDASGFSMRARQDVPRSRFEYRRGYKTTFDMAKLIPFFVEEILPGDSLKIDMTGLCRLATPLVPIMDNIFLDSFFFFVPNRLVWSNWERFMGEQATTADSTQFTIPSISIASTSATVGTPENYMGIIAAAGADTYTINALPFRGMNLIWNDWFRDQDLQDPVTVETDDGPDTIGQYTLLRRNKPPDYFTSCRPWPQKPVTGSAATTTFNTNIFTPGGEFANSLSMGTQGAGAPITGLGFESGTSPGTGASILETGSRTVTYASAWRTDEDTLFARVGAGNFPDIRLLVNDLRTAVQLQHLMEKNARGGTRYAEWVREQFGVNPEDARLQRPEYLGGGRSFIHINPVAQTSASDISGSATVLGELAAVGTGVVQGHGFSSSFTEHGHVIGFLCVTAEQSYQAGVHRMWHRRTMYDIYVPALANLPEQAVLSRELWVDGSANDDTVFGYQERWAEYKMPLNMVTGGFQSHSATPLDQWHLAEHMASRPSLNSAFIEHDPPVDRVLQVDTIEGEQLLWDSNLHYTWVRCMPMFSIPGVTGRL